MDLSVDISETLTAPDGHVPLQHGLHVVHEWQGRRPDHFRASLYIDDGFAENRTT